MKIFTKILALAVLAGATTILFVGCASDSHNHQGHSHGAAAKPYPLETCIVSGDKLGEMGKPVVLIYEGQEMKFCCKDCIKDFKKEPAKYLEKLQEEAKKAK